jgi:hypothetical protein
MAKGLILMQMMMTTTTMINRTFVLTDHYTEIFVVFNLDYLGKEYLRYRLFIISVWWCLWVCV